jgi:hypothetical protein
LDNVLKGLKEYIMKFKFFDTTFASLVLYTSLLVSTAHAGLIHSYDFTGNADDGAGSANGIVNGATLTTDRFGNENSAYSFDGNDSIVANFASSATATYSVWATWDGSGNDMLFNTGANGSGPDLFFVPGACGHNISWNTWDSCDNKFKEGIPSELSDGSFHHYALVNDFSANLATLFVDGDLFGTAAYRSPGNIFTIGSEGAGGGSFGWSGKIDDIRVYDTALDKAGVQSLIAVPEPSTLAIFALGMMGLVSRRLKKQS